MTSRSSNSADAKWVPWLITLLGVGQLLFVMAVGRLRWEHVAADLLIVGLAWAGPSSRSFLLRGGLALWFTGMLMDNQWLWLSLRGPVHSGDLWDLEHALFPAPGDTTWPAYFATRTHPVLDLLCGFSYAAYIYEVILVVLLFFFRKHPRFGQACWAFLAVNFIGVITYMVYPAAPPWYVMQYGHGPVDLLAAPSPAGTARFDALLGINYFAKFYARSPNVFGAMPSLHVAYPVMMTWQLWSLGRAWRVGAAAFAGLVAFSALYLQHHYILDVVGGVVAALLACALVEFAFSRRESPAIAPAPLLPGGDSRV
ncbi:phosphatase PAP2 family protein [Stigmatella hybrida]|uniref:phosphatase PAP2 family protein n=1 Tax=Stigmatella hybrida TaxID=394097 RepID=UPI001CDB28CC|nr:phosphatase PAP2 family protein [Stigmatella hybrida]